MPDRVDVNTWTLDECRDWLARDDGWTPTPTSLRIRLVGESWRRGGHEIIDRNPIGSDLSSIAAAMPEGWWLTTIEFGDISGVRAVAIKRPPLPVGTHVEMTAPTELLARARLAVMCRMAGK